MFPRLLLERPPSCKTTSGPLISSRSEKQPPGQMVPIRHFPRPSRSMHFGDVIEKILLGPRDPKHIVRAQ